MGATAKLIVDGDSQMVLLPEEFRFEGSEVRISKIGDKVILEPVAKKPFDVTAWRAGLERYRDIPFIDDGRDQGINNNAPPEKQPLDLDAWLARLDELRARDFLPYGIPAEPPA